MSGNRLVLANYFNGPAQNQLGSSFTQLAGLSGEVLASALDAISPSRNSFSTFMSHNILMALSDNISSYLRKERFLYVRKTNEDHLIPQFLEESSLTVSLKIPQNNKKKIEILSRSKI